MTGGNDSTLLFAKTLVKFVKNICRAYVLIDGVVEAVNNNFTVDIKVQGTTYSNVPTVVLIGTQASIFPVPVVGTKCLVKWRDGNRGLPQIESFDQIDKLYINCVTLVEFNGGTKGGIPLSPNLVDRINKIEQNQNLILNALKGITIPSTPYPFAPIFTAINDLAITTQSEIENIKITQ